MLSVELARLHSLAEAELRSQAARERDIARARAAELAASEARQRAILQAAHDAVISIDRRGRVTYVNSAFERIFGYRADDVAGRELADSGRATVAARGTPAEVSPATWRPGSRASSTGGSR